MVRAHFTADPQNIDAASSDGLLPAIYLPAQANQLQ